MTREQLLAKFPNASPEFIRLNSDPARGNPTAVVEHGDANARRAETPAIDRNTERFIVRIVSVRKRLLDPDNICEKFLIDGLRYAGLISNDDPGKITLETSQRKTERGEKEHTLVLIKTVKGET